MTLEDDAREWVHKTYGWNFHIERKTTNYWHLNFSAACHDPYYCEVKALHLGNVRYDPGQNVFKGPSVETMRSLVQERIASLLPMINMMPPPGAYKQKEGEKPI